MILLSFFLVSCFAASEPENFLKNTHNKVILAVGDSLTQWYGVKAEENYPSLLQNMLVERWYSYTVINEGKSGDTSEQLLKKIPLLSTQNPEIVIIVIGGNDGLQKLSTTQMQENISKTIEYYQAQGSKIVLAGVDISIIHGLSYRKEFLQVYKNLSQTYPKIYFLDSFLSEVQWNDTLNIQDKIHPNAEGYKIITSHLFDFLEREKLLEK